MSPGADGLATTVDEREGEVFCENYLFYKVWLYLANADVVTEPYMYIAMSSLTCVREGNGYSDRYASHCVREEKW